MLKNAAGETVDVIFLSAEPLYVKNETTTNMLNGSWHTQTIGTRARKLKIKLLATYTVLMDLLVYSDTKEELSVDFMGSLDYGRIMGQPEYSVVKQGSDPLYNVEFELAVVPHV